MTRLITILTILIILSSCSLQDQSGFWNKKNPIENNKVGNSQILFKQEIIEKEFNSKVRIKLSDDKKYYNINKNFNNNITYYNGQLDNILKFKFSKIDNFDKFDSEPALFRDNIIFFDNKGTIFNIDTKNSLKWKKNIYSKIEKKKKPILIFQINNDKLIVTDSLGKFYSLNVNTGKLLWSKTNNAPFNSEIKIDGNRVYITDIENVLRCFSLKNGKELWFIKTEKIFLKSQKKTSIVIVDNLIIFGNSAGDISAVNKNDGELIWQISTNNKNLKKGKTLLKTSELIVYKNYVFFSNNSNQAYLIDLISGSIVWKQDINSFIKSSIINNLIFTITTNGFLVVTDLTTGNIIRITDTFKEHKKRKLIKPVGFALGIKKIYLSTNKGRLIIIDVENGKKIDEIKLDNNIISKPFIMEKNLIIAKDNSLLLVN